MFFSLYQDLICIVSLLFKMTVMWEFYVYMCNIELLSSEKQLNKWKNKTPLLNM